MSFEARKVWLFPSIGLFVSLSGVALALYAMFDRALYPMQAPFFLGLLAAATCSFGFSFQLARGLLRPLQRVHLAAWLPLLAVVSLFGGCWSTRCTSDSLFDYELRLADQAMRPAIQKLSQGADPAAAIPSPAPSGLRIYQGTDGFLVAVTGGSLNIDGSTLIYESETRKWRRKWGDGMDETMETRSKEWKKVYPPAP